MRNLSCRRILPWLGLGCVLVLYVISIVRLHPANFFAYPADDTVYFASARAIAEGRGYILPGLPGTPPATKYPVLLPWLLSFAWKWNSSFPENLPAAIGIIVAFGCGFVISTFVFLKRLAGLCAYEALALTALCALHPLVLFYSATLLSDIPFAALTLAALCVADRQMRPAASAAGCVATGILAGLSTLMRVAGVPIAAGIFVAAITRRAWRQAAIFAACTAPFFLHLTWLTVFTPPTAPPAAVSSYGPGWEQTWVYYTSYLGMRKLSLVNPHMLGTMLLSQFLYLVSDIPGYFISPLFHENIGLWLAATILGLGLILSGVTRQARLSGWQPIHFAFVFYAATILSWDYLGWERFLFPFLPLFAAGLWLEGKRAIAKLSAILRSPRFVADRLLAGTLLAAIGALLLGVAWNFADGGRAELHSKSRERAALLLEKREAYDWFCRNSPKDARVIASEDSALYLYTGRQAMQSIAFLPAGAYDEAVTDRDLDHIADVAQAIGASYWLISDDSDNHWKAYRPLLDARIEQIESVLPEVFRSSRGRVRIYALGCVQHLDDPACQFAARILFPSRRAKPGSSETN